MAFGLAVFVGSLVAAFFLDALFVDILALVVILLGGAVGNGSRSAAKWSLGVMLFYTLVALLLIVAAAFAPERLRIADRPVRPDEIPAVVVSMTFIGVWSLLNVALLVRFLRREEIARDA